MTDMPYLYEWLNICVFVCTTYMYHNYSIPIPQKRLHYSHSTVLFARVVTLFYAPKVLKHLTIKDSYTYSQIY